MDNLGRINGLSKNTNISSIGGLNQKTVQNNIDSLSIALGDSNKETRIVEHKDGSKTKTILRNGKVDKITEYDKNDKITSVKTFCELEDNGKIQTIETTHIDSDGDGYSDKFKRVTVTLDPKTGRKSIVTENEDEEPINDVLDRNHLEYEVYNRKMSNLDSGILMY